MAFALAKENEKFIERMVRSGKFNNQSEVVREALRRMQRDEASFLNPPPLTEQEARRIYAPNPQADKRELAFARASLKLLRKAAKAKR
jgi:putative addiction module CopG family antidote